MRTLSLCALCLILRIHAAHAMGCTPHASVLQPVADVVDNAEESPFMLACHNAGVLKNRPPTSLLVRTPVEADKNGRSTREFLRKVLIKVRTRIEAARNQMQNIETCLPKQAAPECAELNHWADHDLPDYVKAARFHLSLAQSDQQWSTWAGLPSTQPNEQLAPLGGVKVTAWNPLTKPESDKAIGKLRAYMKDIKAERDQRVANGSMQPNMGLAFAMESLLAVRYQHHLKYHQMLSDVPLLQHLKGPEVTHADLTQAFKDMRANLNRESEVLNGYEKQLDSLHPLPADALGLMNYNSQVEETLLQDSADCGLATSLLFTKGNRQLGNSLAVGLPIMAASLFAPPLAGLALGVAAGGLGAFESYQDYEAHAQRAMGFMYADSLGLGTDLTSLEESSRHMKYDFVTLPMGLGAGGLILGSLKKVGKPALANGVAIFMKGR